MYSEQAADRDVWSTRRELLQSLSLLGAAGLLAGCGTTESSSPPPSSDGTPAPTPTPTATASETAAFDCSAVPSSLSTFESSDVDFSFAWDGPTPAAYAVETGEDAVERTAAFYFAREGKASINNWDFNIELSETIGTYGASDKALQIGTEAFNLEYDGTSVPVRHHAVTDDQDLWVLGLPDAGEFRIVRVSAAVMPGEFRCHDAVRTVAKSVIESIRPR